jgi:hypothetical protein
MLHLSVATVDQQLMLFESEPPREGQQNQAQDDRHQILE